MRRVRKGEEEEFVMTTKRIKSNKSTVVFRSTTDLINVIFVIKKKKVKYF